MSGHFRCGTAGLNFRRRSSPWAILRLEFVPITLRNKALLPSLTSIGPSVGGSASTSVTLLCTCRCPLAADYADLMNSLLLGFKSSSLGDSFSIHVMPGLLVYVCRLSSSCWSVICSSSTNASFITFLLRSNLSASCGVILWHCSVRTRQR